MNILFCSDNKYATHLAVVISSILDKNDNINFYIFDFNINEENKDIILSIVKKSNSHAHFISIDLDNFYNFPNTVDYIPLVGYARLNATKYLPNNINKIIYLDIDLLVFESLKPLWNINLGSHFIGACFDSFIEYKTNKYKTNIGLDKHNYYFNSGVMLINLAKWREIDVLDESILWLEKFGDKILYQDQDILNGIFKDKVYYLDSRFNFMPTLFNRIKRRKELHTLEKTTMPIAIVHYCGPKKSWDSLCTHIYSEQYNKIAHLLNIDYKNDIPIKIKLNRLIKKFKNKYIYKIY